MGCGEGLFLFAQIVTIIIFAVYTKLDDGVHPGTTNKGSAGETYNTHRDLVQNLYPFFQDVHVMIFIGFGFLMTFIKTMSWTALAYNWIISIWAFQWAIIFGGFWSQVLAGQGLSKIPLNITQLINGDFGAAAAMITFGAILGKCNLQQLFFLVWWEMCIYGLNAAICFNKLAIFDTGGSIVIHMFGAYFGVAATYFFQSERASRSKNSRDSYLSNLIACIGSIFLWMFWPSFNGALTSGVQQHRVVVNTVLAISASAIGAICVSRMLYGKLEMECVLNATLAGGVAVGTTVELISYPYVALIIGVVGGLLSAFGFAKIQPWLADKMGLQDTCGLNALHGMPGIFAALCSLPICASLFSAGFPKDYFGGKTGGQQAMNQLYAILITLANSIISGAIGGAICGTSVFSPPHALFRDDDHFYGVLNYYTKSFLQEGNQYFNNVQQFLNCMKDFIADKQKSKANYNVDSLFDELCNFKDDDEVTKAKAI